VLALPSGTALVGKLPGGDTAIDFIDYEGQAFCARQGRPLPAGAKVAREGEWVGDVPLVPVDGSRGAKVTDLAHGRLFVVEITSPPWAAPSCCSTATAPRWRSTTEQPWRRAKAKTSTAAGWSAAPSCSRPPGFATARWCKWRAP